MERDGTERTAKKREKQEGTDNKTEQDGKRAFLDAYCMYTCTLEVAKQQVCMSVPCMLHTLYVYIP